MKNNITLFIFIIFFSIGCSSKIENIFHSQLLQTSSKNNPCIKSIASYYWNLKKRKYIEMYKKELPSFRYFYNFNLYKGYYTGFKKFDSIDIITTKKLNDNVYKITLKFYKKNNPLFSITEKWVIMDGRCYHYLYDPFIFNK